MSKTNPIRFRPNVAGILQNSEGRILVCERLNLPGAWQFPQGGVDRGETREQALIREMNEEIGLQCHDYQVIASKGPYRYLFESGRRKRGYGGQEQFYFLARLTAPESHINVVKAHQEFRSTKWILPEEFELSWLPTFKIAVYQAVLRDFFGVIK